MDFEALKNELAGRGFNHLTDAQRGVDINDARQRIDHMYLWPYRETSVTGIAPLYVDDLGTIEAVTNETGDYALMPTDYRTLLDSGDTAAVGAPQMFYVGSGNIVATYPTDTSASIGVQYWKITSDLTSDADEPLAPARFHMLIVDMAAQRAYMRTDNYGAAQALQPFIDQQLGAMVETLLGGQQIAGPQGWTSVTQACDG